MRYVTSDSCSLYSFALIYLFNIEIGSSVFLMFTVRPTVLHTVQAAAADNRTCYIMCNTNVTSVVVFWCYLMLADSDCTIGLGLVQHFALIRCVFLRTCYD